MNLFLFVIFITETYTKHVEYTGWKSYYVRPSNNEQLKSLNHISLQYDIDILSHPIIERDGVVLVKPQHQGAFIKGIEDEGIYYKIHREDLNIALDDDNRKVEARREEYLKSNTKEMLYDNYQTLSEINEYLEDISNRYPETVTLVTPGNSFERRPINYLKISSTNFDSGKPIIFVDGGIHAREWISPSTVTYMIRKLTEDVTEPELLDKFDWILMPVVNPDGYDYTFTEARFWRKTRSTNQHELSSLCPGVDGNRNYDFRWNTTGTSPNPCSDTYPGSYPFSEIETRIVRDIFKEYVYRIAMYLTMHSYGSMILYPWGHDGTISDNDVNLNLIANAMAKEINSNQLPEFPKYVFGNSNLVIGYPASGASDDYAHQLGVPLSYTIELPGLGFGIDAFHLDPKYIVQVCQDTWAGVTAGARKVDELLNNKNKSIINSNV